MGRLTQGASWGRLREPELHPVTNRHAILGGPPCGYWLYRYRHGVPQKITVDGSEAHAVTICSYNEEHGTATIIRHVKYLNNLVGQDHRAVRWATRSTLGQKRWWDED